MMEQSQQTSWSEAVYRAALTAMVAFVHVFLAATATIAGPSDFRVVDGDTIANGSTTFRLFGIDAPEAGQKCASASGRTWPCGQEAIAFLEDLVVGHAVRCDDRGRDEYGRVLSVCHSDNIEINASILKAGLAWSFRRYAHDYDSLEDEIRVSGVGVWQAPTEPPWDYRAKRWEFTKQQAPAGCPIKGNINSEGERIYHAPWSPWYDRTKVSPDKGERWFCTEGEAVAAGWRAPYWGR